MHYLAKQSRESPLASDPKQYARKRNSTAGEKNTITHLLNLVVGFQAFGSVKESVKVCLDLYIK